MIIKCYEEIFKVTETLQNGKERTCKKSVLCPIFKAGRHVIEFDRIDRAIIELGDLGYYDTEHIETKFKKLIVTDDLVIDKGV